MPERKSFCQSRIPTQEFPGNRRSATGKAARLSAIRIDIMENLGRNDLSADALARQHGISPRYLRKLFEDDGMSFSSFVVTQRLLKVQSLLIDRLYCRFSIARIAHDNGFGDISYFNRAYRRQFGETPSDTRTKAKEERSR